VTLFPKQKNRLHRLGSTHKPVSALHQLRENQQSHLMEAGGGSTSILWTPSIKLQPRGFGEATLSFTGAVLRGSIQPRKHEWGLLNS